MKIIILMFSLFQIKISSAEETILIYGKVKSIEGKIIKIEQPSKEIFAGPKELIINFDDQKLGHQYFEIKTKDLKEFNKFQD